MTTKINIEQVACQPFNGKYGPTNKVGIRTKTAKGEDIWINGFLNYIPEWEPGQSVELEVFKKESNGKTFWNFKVPKKADLLERRVEVLEAQIKTLSAMIKGKLMAQPRDTDEDVAEQLKSAFNPGAEVQGIHDIPVRTNLRVDFPPHQEIRVEDIPF